MANTELEQWSVKHRPTSLDSFIGSAGTVSLVRSFLERRTGHALLLTGPSGCGKTTLAKIIAKHYAKTKVNMQETNATADSGIDEVRRMIEASRYMPMQEDACKVFVIEEAHGLTGKAAAALLRPIEEPPHNRLIWILVTDRPWKLDGAVLNRLRKFPVELPDEKELARYLLRIVKAEKALRHIDGDELKKACLLMARVSGCVPREAVQLLQNAHEQRLRDFADIKKYIATSAASGDTQIDRVAAEVLSAILGTDKTEVAVSKLIKAYASVDAMGLLTRMVFQLHSLLLFALAGKSNLHFAVRPTLAALKGHKPPVEDMVETLRYISKVRNDLREVVLDPSTMILPALLDCVFRLRGK